MICKLGTDPGSHDGISFGYAASVMRDECKQHMVVPDVDIGMMSGVLRDGCDPVDEGHRFDEGAEDPLPFELSISEHPFGVRP